MGASNGRNLLLGQFQVDNAGDITATSLALGTGTTDNFAVCPPSEITSAPVTNIAYAQGSIAGGSSTTLTTLQMVNSTANATAKLHLDLTDLLLRSTAGKGATITAITLVYTLTGAVLTAGPSVAVVTQTFGAAGATAAAPTAAAAAGGTITPSPASPPTAIPTAGRFYTVQYTLGTALALNNPLQRAVAEITFPMTSGGTAHLTAAIVAFNDLRY